jgi:membrane-associated phospholipid phosphatase
MENNRRLGFSVKMMVVAYLTWLAYFIPMGHLAATMNSTDWRTAVDVAIPFWSWTVWIYDFCYFLPLFAVFVVTDGHFLNRLLLAVFTATFSATVVYFIFPISYPDPIFGDSISDRFLAWQFAIDFQPGANKMPSLHVANSFMAWLAVKTRSRKASAVFLVSAILIAISTLFTKKHLVLDVALGAAWAFGAWYIAGKLYARFFDASLPPDEALLVGLRLKRRKA